MPSSRRELILVALIAAGGGYWLGALVNSPKAGLANEPSTSLSSAIADQRVNSSGATLAQSIGNASSVEQFWTAMTIADDGDRMAEWNAMLRKMSPDEAAAVRDLFQKMTDQGRWLVPEWAVFWPRWGEIDAPGALANMSRTVANVSHRPQVAEWILRGWSKVDPTAARAWIDANRSAYFVEGAMKGYISGVSRKDLNLAIEAADAFGYHNSMRGLMEDLTEQALQQHQLSGLLDWWSSLPNDPSAGTARSEAVSLVYERLRRANDPRVGEWLATLAQSPYRNDQVIGEYVKNLGWKNPADALAWVSNLPPSPTDGKFVGLPAAVKAVANQDSATLQDWINRLPQSPLREQAVAAYTDYQKEKPAGGRAVR